MDSLKKSAKNILLTGIPGIGKTTTCIKFIEMQ